MNIAVINNSGVSLSSEDVVYQTGFVQPQQLPTISLASAAALSTAKVIGITIKDIPNGTIGAIKVSGNYISIDTSSFSSNAKVYLSDTGSISNISGTIEVIIGRAVKIGVNGTVRIVCT